MVKRFLFGLVAIALVVGAAYSSLLVAPEERTMGALYRIFFLHVSCAWAGLTSFAICFVANLLYVWKRKEKYDGLGVACAEVGLAFTTVVLITGPIWAKPAWGIYWTWDARLTSTFILWLLYISYLLLRTLVEEADRRALLSALFGIFAFIDVPIVFGAIRWWRTQHPQPVILGAPGSGLHPAMRAVLFFCWIAMLGLMALLLHQRYQLEALRGEFDVVRRESEAG